MKEISIEADQVKRSTISDLRTAAQNEKIFGDTEESETEKNDQIPFPELQKKYTCIVDENIVTIMLPAGTNKETLLDIKSIIETYTPGHHHVWLDIGGQTIDTKKNIGA